ncbi:FecR domain-containing protein [Candidatus Saccharibacteria bacterium]|nr:FecR domain-containing protein [Candidatus Saccharibacteria bacterium]
MNDPSKDEPQMETENQKPEELDIAKTEAPAVESEVKSPSVSRPKLLLAKSARLKDKLIAHKKLFAIVAVALIIVIGGTIAMLSQSNSQKQTADQNSSDKVVTKVSATVSYIEGAVELKDGSEYTEISTNTILAEGDAIRTAGATSRATIALENGSFARLNGDTEIILTSLNSDEIVIMQNNGHVYSRVSPSIEGTYTIETNNGTYTALGTAFKTTTTGDEESVEVYESKVTEGTSDKTIAEGEKLLVKIAADTTKNGTITPLDIEAIKTDSFVKWCRDEDEKIDDFKDHLGFLKDISSPELSLTSPSNGSTITVDSTDSSSSVVFKGKTEVGATLTVQSVSVSGSAPIPVTVAADGSFESDSVAGIIGTSKYEVISKDKTGNKSVVSISVIFKNKSLTAATEIIVSYAGYIDGKYQVTWSTTSSYIDGDGFKVVWNTSGSPVYPGSDAQFVGPDERQTGLYLAAKSTETKYYVKVCRYSDGACDNYSNQITVTVPAE